MSDKRQLNETPPLFVPLVTCFYLKLMQSDDGMGAKIKFNFTTKIEKKKIRQHMRPCVRLEWMEIHFFFFGFAKSYIPQTPRAETE